MELLKGRPENAENRLEKEIRVYELLDSLGIDYQRVDHAAAMTMEACGEIDRALSEGMENEVEICKNLFLCNRQATEFYLLLIPGDKPFKTKYLSAQIGSSRLSFATSSRSSSSVEKRGSRFRQGRPVIWLCSMGSI